MADDEEAPPTAQWLASTEEGAPAGPFSEDGLPHGKGVMKYPPPPAGEDEEEKPGDAFEGTMTEGKREGPGKYTWSNGAVFEGNYTDNKKQGKGKMTFPDKSVYEGDYTDDQMEGNGTYTYSNGDIYRGQFKAGKRSGSGMYHFKFAGCQMVGDWLEGGFIYGRWIYKDGSMFFGEFDKPIMPTAKPPPSTKKGKPVAKPAPAPHPTERAPSQGAYFFSGSSLVQKGSFKRLGTWRGDDPVVAKVDILSTLVAPK